MKVLGLTIMGNSAAALIDNGEIVFAAEEERFSRVKNDGSVPIRSVNALLKQSGNGLTNVLQDFEWMSISSMLARSN